MRQCRPEPHPPPACDPTNRGKPTRTAPPHHPVPTCQPPHRPRRCRPPPRISTCRRPPHSHNPPKLTAPTPPSATHLPAPAPQSAVADVPLPPDPAPPQPPDDEVPLPQTATPAGNPGTAAADRDALTVTGDDVASAGPDAAYRNMPPHYPPGAVRQHIEGSVQAAVSIAPDGSPTAIDIVISSGSALLDDAVRDAVLKWHFKPALRDGEPVPSVYKLQMNFRTQAAE